MIGLDRIMSMIPAAAVATGLMTASIAVKAERSSAERLIAEKGTSDKSGTKHMPSPSATGGPNKETKVTTTGMPDIDARIKMIHDYSVALGRKFACDHKSAEMVSDISRYTYVMQIPDSDVLDMTAASKAGLTAGMEETAASKDSCDQAAKRADAMRRQMTDQETLVAASARTLNLLSGSALACDVAPADVEAMQSAFRKYTGTEGRVHDVDNKALQEAGLERIHRVGNGCSVIRPMFDDVKEVFVP